MREVEKDEANYVLIVSNPYTKKILYKIYFDLEGNEGVGNMLRYVTEQYPDMIDMNSRVDFARVIAGDSLWREL
jgi:hypothetical protein